MRSVPHSSNSYQVDVLRTTYSWFSCYTYGEWNSNGQKSTWTWYKTMGDDTGRWGYVPASVVHTWKDFDLNPGAYGLPRCS